ncbi:hypothetical protein C8R44DRAFT_365128 [Mycena epipterygia]|nr:hypothetical protein C8R44DRAFT_365128 [Mycena epipterygia]
MHDSRLHDHGTSFACPLPRHVVYDSSQLSVFVSVEPEPEICVVWPHRSQATSSRRIPSIWNRDDINNYPSVRVEEEQHHIPSNRRPRSESLSSYGLELQHRHQSVLEQPSDEQQCTIGQQYPPNDKLISASANNFPPEPQHASPSSTPSASNYTYRGALANIRAGAREMRPRQAAIPRGNGAQDRDADVSARSGTQWRGTTLPTSPRNRRRS